MLSSLTRYLEEDLSLFQRALAGEDVIAPSSLRRRPSPTA